MIQLRTLQSLFRYLRLIADITVVLNPSIIPVITSIGTFICREAADMYGIVKGLKENHPHT